MPVKNISCTVPGDAVSVVVVKDLQVLELPLAALDPLVGVGVEFLDEHHVRDVLRLHTIQVRVVDIGRAQL